jgi:hypothetical protein
MDDLCVFYQNPYHCPNLHKQITYAVRDLLLMQIKGISYADRNTYIPENNAELVNRGLLNRLIHTIILHEKTLLSKQIPGI